MAVETVDCPQVRAAAAAGDRDAFAALWRECRPAVVRFLRSRGCGPDLVDDLTSEAFLRAWANLSGWREQGRPFGAWVVTIARRCLVDHHRSAYMRRVTPVAEVFEDATPLGGVAEDVAWLALTMARQATRLDMWQEALAGLSDPQRECLRLRFLERLSIRDTALKLGIPEGAVKSLQHRACRRLSASPVVRELWADLLDGGGV